jgi:anaerobic magnesium-protoporphyrin IX monomethyl ester cyclase
VDILLINAPVKVGSEHAGLTPPLGLAYIGAVLLKNDYHTSAIDFNITGYNPAHLEAALAGGITRLIGISAQTETYLNGLEIARTAKRLDPSVKVVFGGPHASVMYRQVAAENSVDVVVRGEGEYTMLELAGYFIRNKGELAKIRGIAYRDNEEVIATPERPFIETPDNLPYPARWLFPLPLYKVPGTVLMSRGGCPFACHFCAVNNIWQGKRRFRRSTDVVAEVVSVLRSGFAKEITFVDDTLSLDRRAIIDLCRLLQTQGEADIRWTCSTRVDLVDEELLREMYLAGCRNIQYGVEAGSQIILNSIGKKITIEQIKSAVKMTLDNGIRVTCSFMFPHPEDTEATIREQIILMKELIVMGAEETLALTAPFPGTYDYDHADELGIKILAKSWDEYDAKHLIIETRNLTKARLESLLEELVLATGLKGKTG